MQIRLGAVDGHTYESDTWSDEEMIAEMDKVDWVFGDGFLETQLVPGDMDGLCSHVAEFFKDIIVGKHENGNITLTKDGSDKVFAADKIVWVQVIR